ncbi:MAG: DMT family transporter, partial [Oscillospiraceae bacterium]|nr:DMT family transporter [Oscillospiraceae bacterium]
KFGEGQDPIVITVLQFASAAVCFWVTSLITDGAPQAVGMDVLPSVVYLCLFCTAAALLLQNFGQKYTTPSAAALLLSLESVFGTAFSALMGREDFTVRMICGFVTIFLAIIVSETKLSFLRKKKMVQNLSTEKCVLR